MAGGRPLGSKNRSRTAADIVSQRSAKFPVPAADDGTPTVLNNGPRGKSAATVIRWTGMQQELVRAKIRVIDLVERVQAYALNEKYNGRHVIMDEGQLQAAKLLLGKSLPDLQRTEVVVDPNNNPDSRDTTELSDTQLLTIIAVATTLKPPQQQQLAPIDVQPEESPQTENSDGDGPHG